MPNRPLRILIVHNAYRIPGGEDSVVENEAALLKAAGCEVEFYLKNNKEMDDYRLFQKALLPFRSIYSGKTYREVKTLIQKKQIDLVHVHNTLTIISPSVYYAALSCGVPVIQTVHNYRLICPGALLLRNGHVCTDCLTGSLSCSVRHRCYRVSRIQTLISSLILRYHRKRDVYRKISYICLTEFNREMLLKLNTAGKHPKERIRPANVYVKPNFAADPGAPIPYEQRAKRILYVGRMESYKGIFDLLDAWTQYESSIPPVVADAPVDESAPAASDIPPVMELWLCGSGPEESRITELISKRGLKRVRFLGQCPHEQILKLMGDSLAVCMPSKCYEGFPVTIAESYACGTPVIGSNLGNVGNLIAHGQTGFHFPPGDIDALAAYFINWEKEYEKTARTISAQARRLYEECYTPEHNLKQLLAIYEKVLQHENRNHRTQSE